MDSSNLPNSSCRLSNSNTFMFICTKEGKKTLDLIFHFVQVCYGIYGVRWVRGGGTEGSYSYSKTLIVGS